MEWSEIAAFLRRRRLLIVLAVVVTMAAGAVAVTRVPPEYTAQGEVLLLPPSTVVGKSGNPFLSLDGLSPIGSVVATSLSSTSRVEALKSQGATAEYVVAPDAQSPAPMLLVSVNGTSVDETMKTLGLVMDSLGPAIEGVQQDVNVPPDAYVKLLEVARSEEPERSLKAPIRAMIVVAGGVGVLLLALVVIYDSARRSKRAGALRGQASGDDSDPSAPTREHLGLQPPDPTAAAPQGGTVQEQVDPATAHHPERSRSARTQSRQPRWRAPKGKAGTSPRAR